MVKVKREKEEAKKREADGGKRDELEELDYLKGEQPKTAKKGQKKGTEKKKKEEISADSKRNIIIGVIVAVVIIRILMKMLLGGGSSSTVGALDSAVEP